MARNPLTFLQLHWKTWCPSVLSYETKKLVHKNYSKCLTVHLILEILTASAFLLVYVNCETSPIFNAIPNLASKSHFITRPKNQNRMSSGVVQQPQTPIIENEDDWPSFFPPYAHLDKILSFAEDVQTGFNYGDQPQPQSSKHSRPSSSNRFTSNSSFPLSGRSNMMTSNPSPIYSRSNALPNQRQSSLPHTRTTQNSQLNSQLLNDRYGFPVPVSLPLPLDDHSNSRFISTGAPADFLLKRKGGGGSPAWQNSWHEEEKYETTTESSIEMKMDDDEDTETSTKYPYSEETEEESGDDETTTTKYKKTTYTTTEDPTSAADPTTLAPFTLNDIQIPVGFIRTEFMIGYCFLGLMYGMGFLVLFQSICVPIAKLFVFISYLWAVYFGVWSPISKTDAMQYLPPN